MRLEKTEKEIIGIIAPASLKYVPYIQYYIDIFSEKDTDIRVLSWNRMGLDEIGVDFSYDLKVQDAHRIRMFFGYMKFIRACKKYIRKSGITRLIILTAAPAFFMGTRYLKRFSGNYILDIRDDSPLVRVFPKVFRKICDMAKNIIVSSPNYNEWIPFDTILCHNADTKQIMKCRELPAKKDYNKPISIAFAGMMIEGPINIEILKNFENDERFAFYYIGKPNAQKESIAEYVRTTGMKNVIFEGTYNKDEIVDIYREKADLVNILRARSTVNRNALPNKLYDAIISGVPIVVFDHNQAIARYVQQYNLGLILREEDMQQINDVIFEKMTAFDYDAFDKGRRDFLDQACKDMDCFRETVERFAQQPNR